MPGSVDSRLAELAVARNLLTFSELVQCIRLKSERGDSLADVAVQEGFLDSDEADRLTRDIEQDPEDEVVDELEAGETMISEELVKDPGHAATQPIREPKTKVRDESTVTADTVAGDPEGPLDPPTDETSDRSFEAPESDGAETIDSMDYAVEVGGERYLSLDELGEGGMGKVLLAHDDVMHREIAVKMLLDDPQGEHAAERLIHEARLTGQLEHPNIVPTYELGEDEDGDPFYTMRVVREESLAQLLDRRRETDADEYSLIQLASFLRQVALALEFTHDRGVVHRDIKPENILIGEYGEVFIIDWGVAKVADRSLTDYDVDELLDLPEGAILGTPYYMSPEQARGQHESVDARSDIYSLGAVLYELLTLTPVFPVERTLPLLMKITEDPPEPPSERAPDREIPAELEAICMKALEKDPDDRFQSAQEFADELEMFIEGVKQRERRLEAAREATQRGHEARDDYEQTKRRHRQLVEQLEQRKLETPAWASIDEKEKLWELEQRADDLRVELERKFGDATRIYEQALGYASDMEEPRRALADLYWERFQEAEDEGDRARAAYFEELVRQYNEGEYDDLLEGNATISLTSDPSEVEANLFRYEEVNRRLVGREVEVGLTTPVAPREVPHGSYVFEVGGDGYVRMQVPVLLDRLDTADLEVQLYTNDQVPEDFVVVPGGPFISSTAGTEGGDEVIELPDFAIQRHPVTCAEYLEFLNDLAANNLERAKAHVPRQPDKPPYFPLEDGKFHLPEDDHEGDAWNPDWPICMVNHDDAVAFAAWRSERDNRDYGLPSAAQWEKAARGVDGRLYPWGNHFDASFCKMQKSDQGKPLPAPVESFPIDRSPYGAMDMAGNVQELSSTRTGESGDQLIVQGAAHLSIALMCRLDWNIQVDPTERRGFLGFRLVRPLE